MSANIFISYRRDDSQLFCNYLSQSLAQRFGSQAIFLDKKLEDEDSIPPGSPLESKIRVALDAAKIILVVIGENWDVLDKNKNKRITLKDDWVRKEIEYALTRAKKEPDQVHVIPIWVGNHQKIKDMIDHTPLPDIEGIKSNVYLNFPNEHNVDLLQSDGAKACVNSNIEALAATIEHYLGDIQSLFKFFLENDEYLSKKYDVQKLEFLDQGSISTLFKTFDNYSKRDVVLKVLNSKSEAIKDKFDRSTRLAVKLSDLPHFMTIYDLHLEGDYYFYSQQYIDGRNLRKVIKSDYPQGLNFSLIHKIMLNVGEAILHTHQLVGKSQIQASLGYVFCNIKPSNLMFDQVTQEIFLSPFNLCLKDDNFFSKKSVFKELDQKRKELDLKQKNDCADCEDLFFEELAYLLPERVDDDRRPALSDIYKLADLYMLGLLGFELLTGQHPPTFQDFEKLKSAQANAYQEITAASISREDVPKTFQDIIINLTKRKPFERQASYCKVEDAVRTFKNVNYFLNLAQESYSSCLDSCGDEFEQEFIEIFLDKLEYYEKQENYYESACKKRKKKEQPAHLQLSFKNKNGVVDEKKKMKHAKTLKESILFLFAYFSRFAHIF